MTITTTPLLADGAEQDQEVRFFDRELSWLSFNERVLLQSCLPHNPVGEQLQFISISSTNLDEFYMVRLAGLYQLESRGYHHIPQSEERLDSSIAQIENRAGALFDSQQKRLEDVLSRLADEGCELLVPENLTDAEKEWLEAFFDEHILPVLSPITLDPTHPFPFIQNKGKGLLLEMTTSSEKHRLAVILISDKLSRFVRLPGQAVRMVPIEQVILRFVNRLYTGFEVKQSAMFRVLRDSEIEIDDEADDLVSQFEDALKRRRRGNVVLLSLSSELSRPTMRLLQKEMALSASQIKIAGGFVGLGDFADFVALLPKRLHYPPYSPRFPQRIVDYKGDCFAAIRNKDIIVHHPFESFDVVVRFLEQAADDSNVLAIRQTLYRTSPHSPIVRALVKAAENGKSVVALIELKARFDEENNIQLARILERAGVQVAYGLIDLKVHSKLSHVVRQENDTLVSYTHCGTGNYHPITAKIYTDLSFFTCDQQICDDVRQIFNYLTSYITPEKLNKVIISPKLSAKWLHEKIDAEMDFAKAGKPASIWLKVNAVVDKDIIGHMYRASEAGVSIDLIVRGICCLRPGIAGLSENIRVKSIVGRYLEHGRIYAFGNGETFGEKATQVYIASADIMPRNLYRRVESYIPLENPTVRQQVLKQIIGAQNHDRRDSWMLTADGSYVKMDSGDDSLSAHDYFMQNPSLSGLGSLSVEAEQPAHKASR